MTDPTKQAQAATAKTAREVLTEHSEAFDAYAKAVLGSDLTRFHEGRRLADSFLALRALLASPESVGWLQAQAEAYNLRLLHERTRERDGLRKHLDGAYAALASETRPGDAMQGETVGEAIEAIKRECDSLKTDLAAAARREALARQAEQDIRVLKDRAEADLAAARGDLEQNDLAALKGSPPPATEAPISERARWIADKAWAVWMEHHSRRDTEGYGFNGPEFPGCVEIAQECLAAAERAVKGEATT